jgi:molybdate transport system substrate-binding protein
MMPVARAVSVILLLGGYALAGAQTDAALHVAAAADLQPILPAIAADFEQHNHVRIAITYGASGTLTTQIENGAPFDVFMAADMKYPERIISAGLADSARPVLYARGVLVLWARRDSPVQPLSLGSLRDEKVKRLAIANPQTAPYGRAALAMLESMGLTSQVKDKLVTAENVAQAAQFAESGNADAGLISLNSAANPPLLHEGTYVVMPPASYPPIEQGAVVLRRAHDAKIAHAFVEAVAKVTLQPSGAVIQPNAQPAAAAQH